MPVLDSLSCILVRISADYVKHLYLMNSYFGPLTLFRISDFVLGIFGGEDRILDLVLSCSSSLPSSKGISTLPVLPGRMHQR